MDLSKTIIAKSDQLNADDLITGARTFTVQEVRPGSEEQPVSIVLAEWPNNRPFKPSKTVQRILAYCWGAETDDWPQGAQMTLYRDEKVKWAGEEVGGIRVSHLSHIKGVQKIALQESKHKKSLHTIQPLAQKAAEPTPAELAAQVADGLNASTTEAEVREWGNRAHAKGLLDLPPSGSTGTLRDLVQARLADLVESSDVETPDPADELTSTGGGDDQ